MESETSGLHENSEAPSKKQKLDAEEETPKQEAKIQPYKRHKIEPQTLQTRRGIQVCCKTNDLQKAWGLFLEAQSNGVEIEPQTFFCLLGLCDGFGDRGLHIGTPRPSEHPEGNGERRREFVKQEDIKDDSEVSVKDRQTYAFELKRQLDERCIRLNETAYTALVRVLCKSNTLDRSLEAEKIIDQAQQQKPSIKPKLRLYSALLMSWAHQRNMAKLVQLWQQILELNQPQLKLSEKEYCAIIECATAVGDSGVMERVLTDLAEDVLVPSHVTIKAIEEWFCSEHSCSGTPTSNVLRLSNTKLQLTSAPSMGPVTLESRSWTISRGCPVEIATGKLTQGCMKGCHLKSVKLAPEHRKAMLEMNDTIVKHDGLPQDTSEFAGGGKGRKKRADQPHRRRQHWIVFQSWLNEQVGPPRDIGETMNGESHAKRPFDVVLDGANIGYFKQNYINAPRHVDYKQIDWVVRRFSDPPENKRVLVVLHERHFSPSLMPDWAQPIVSSWQRGNVSLYQAPAGCNDDWFWLHAALWSGKNCMALTNDEMRDHHFQMLSHRSFLRWKERHQIRFQFGEWEENGKQREVLLEHPEVYSRRIQRVEGGLVLPLPRKGDENRFLDGDFVSKNDPVEETYVCITPLIDKETEHVASSA